MSELVPILDKLVNAGIVFLAVIVVIFVIIFGVVLSLVMRVFHHIREEEHVLRKRDKT